MGSVPGLERFPGKGNGNPLQYSYPESSMNKEAWQGAVQGVTEFRQDWVPKHTGMQIYTCIFYYFLDHNTFIFFLQWDTIYPKCWMISFFFSTIFTPRLRSVTHKSLSGSIQKYLLSFNDYKLHLFFCNCCFHIDRFNPPWIESTYHLLSSSRLKEIKLLPSG